MTIPELKRAFMDERPVMHGDITYQRVTAVIYRKTPGGKGVFVQGELLDKSGRAVTIAAVDRITLAERTGTP